jgi:putative addiction module component (TIGR02574 family)
MSMTSDILSAALGLSPAERAEIAHELLLSLGPEATDETVDPAWEEEIRNRLESIRQGTVKLRSWDEALADIRRSIQAHGSE